MTYASRILQPDERVVAAGRLHWTIFLPAAVLLAAAAAMLLTTALSAAPPGPILGYRTAGAVGLLGCLAFLATAIRRRVTEIIVTDRRVILKRGLIARYATEVTVRHIETVELEQDVIGRLLDYGTLVIRGTGGGLTPLHQVDAPLPIRNAIAVR